MQYADLTSAIASYAKRGDTAALAPTWIALVEAKLNRELAVAQLLARAPLVIAAEFTPAPADFVRLRAARLLDGPYGDVRCLSIEQMNARRAEQRSGTLDSVALIGGQLCVSPVPGQSWNLELIYYAEIPPLSAAAPSNAVLAAMPDLYLFGCLAEAADFYEDDAQLQKYGARFADALKGYNEASLRAEMGFNLSPGASARAF